MEQKTVTQHTGSQYTYTPCPYCQSPLDPNEASNSLSRWMPSTMICASCGDFEAFVEYDYGTPDKAFTALHDGSIGLAIKNDAGYIPLPRTHLSFDRYDEAQDHADKLNNLLGIDQLTAFRIVASSMFNMVS